MLEARAWSVITKVLEDNCKLPNESVVIALAIVIRYQQAQIMRLIDLVDQLVATQNTTPVDYEHKQ